MHASLFQIQKTDEAEFASLPSDVRDRINRLVAVFREIHAAPNKQAACTEQAAAFRGVRGLAAHSLSVRYYRFIRAGGDWRVLINRSLAGPKYWRPAGGQKPGLPREFIEFWRELCERNQRKDKPAHRELLKIMRTHHDATGKKFDAIPGYDAWPVPDKHSGIPDGWSYANLRRHAPSNFEKLVTRQGRGAGYAERPLVFTTRVGLEVGQYYLFDDMWHDFKVVTLGQRHAQRLLQFHSLDLFSGCNFARGIKPVIENEITQAQERLKEVEMLYLVAYVLGVIGYRPAGTTLVAEHGTAAIRPDIEQMLSRFTGGAVKVQRSGLEGAAAFAGMYHGRSKGNWRMKAALESSHNLIHNETANTLLIPGQVGMDRDHCPEDMHRGGRLLDPETGKPLLTFGREKHADALLAAMAVLEPHEIDQLRLPFLEFNQALRIITKIFDGQNGLAVDSEAGINHRKEHELEGWIEAGLVTTEFSLGPDSPWLPAARLLGVSDAQRTALEPLISSRVRKLSPAQVFTAAAPQLVRLPAHCIAMLLAEVSGQRADECRVDGGMIEFQDRDLAPSPLRYEALLCNGGGRGEEKIRLRDGEKYTRIVNPLALDELYLFDAKGGFVGTCPRGQRVCRSDTDALHRACGRAAKAETELLAPIAARGARVTRQRIDDARHNAAVLASAKAGQWSSGQEAKKPESASPPASPSLLGDPLTEADMAEVLGGGDEASPTTRAEDLESAMEDLA